MEKIRGVEVIVCHLAHLWMSFAEEMDRSTYLDFQCIFV